MNETGTDFTVLVVFGFLTLVGSVSVASAIWASIRRYQIRNETMLKLLEGGHSLDQNTLEKLLNPPAPSPRGGTVPSDPRVGYRRAAFVDFLIGFGTILIAISRDGGPSYPLIGLGILPLILAITIWRSADKAFREGTLPTLNHGHDPRHSSQTGGGWLFFIGYATIFAGIIREGGLSYPIVGLGILAILVAIAVWTQGDKEYREGLLTRTATDPERE